MNRLIYLNVILLSILPFNIFGSNELQKFKDLKGKIDIAGGTAHIPVIKEVATKIMRYNPEIKITIAGGGSGVGIKKVGEGLIDIGNSGRKPKDEEIKKYNLKMFAWAIDGVSVVLNSKNPIDKLTTEQIIDIYSGKIKNWKEIGGKDLIINIYTRDQGSGTRSVFWKKQLKKKEISKSSNVVASNGAMKTAILNDLGGVGYVSIGHIDNTVKVPYVDNIKPSQESSIDGSYKVVRKLYSNTKGEASKLVKTFLDYLMSEDGAKIIEKNNLIPIKS